MKLSKRQTDTITAFATQGLRESLRAGRIASTINEDVQEDVGDDHVDLIGTVSNDPEFEDRVESAIEAFTDAVKAAMTHAVAKALQQDPLDVKPVFEMSESESDLADGIREEVREYVIEMAANSIEYIVKGV